MANVKYNALTARKVATIKRPGTYVDGLGLLLRVDDAGNARWVLRLSRHGKTRDIGLGSAREVSLAEARDRRDEIRKAIREGFDPISARDRKKAIPTFEDYARRLHETIKSDWRNPKHAAQWLSTLDTYAFPRLGKVRIDQIDAPAIKSVLEPIWTEKAETARRVKQRIRRVLSAAIAEGYRPGPNPAVDATEGLNRSRAKPEHFPAMPFAEVPTFFRSLDYSDMTPTGRLAFKFLIVTATRTNEVLNAVWAEFDIKNALWVIPPERMKMKAEHRVPLSPLALAILKDARFLDVAGTQTLVFPGPKGTPFSNMIFGAALKRMSVDYTAHGFRSAFRDWAEERTQFPHEVKEAALAHKPKDKVERAYRRTDLLEQRREMMNEWSTFLSGSLP